MSPLIRRSLSPFSYRPVGHQGVEPCATALSERPLHRLGSGQWKTEVSSPAASRPPQVFKTRCRAGGASSRAEDGGPDPLRLPAHPISNRGPPPRRLHLPRLSRPMRADGRWRRTENSNPSAFAPGRFPSSASTLAGSSSRAEGGAVEAHGVIRASLSGRARRPGRFTFHKAVGGDMRVGRYAQTAPTVISPPHCVR